MKIEILYPEICNLYGDLANVRYLKESINDVEIVNTSLKDTPAFVNEEVDLIYMGTTTEEGIRLVVNALSSHVDRIKQLIEKGQFILLTGNALDIFGEFINIDASMTGSEYKIECLGILPTHSEYQMMKRHNSFYIGEFTPDNSSPIKIVGFKSIFGHTYPNANNSKFQDGWFNTIKGFGCNPDEKAEGFKINNLYATYLTGPLLPLNPLLTNWVIQKLTKSGSDIKAAHFEAAMIAYEDRLKDFSNEHFNPAY